MLVVVKGKNVVFVSTDGHRLAQAKGELTAAAKGEKEGLKAIIPVKALSLVDRLIDNPEEMVGFQVRENQVMVHTANATLTTSLVEGQFPPFEDVIPKDTDRKVTASTADFLERHSPGGAGDNGRKQRHPSEVFKERPGAELPESYRGRIDSELRVQIRWPGHGDRV